MFFELRVEEFDAFWNKFKEAFENRKHCKDYDDSAITENVRQVIFGLPIEYLKDWEREEWEKI